jgi:hypothetical protein
VVASAILAIAGAMWWFQKSRPDRPELSIHQGKATGITTELLVVLAPRGAKIATLQFDVIGDFKTIDLTVRDAEEARNSGKRTNLSSPAPGTRRVLIAGFNQTVLPSGTVAVLVLKVKAETPAHEYSLSLTNCSAADPEGDPVHVAVRN